MKKKNKSKRVGKTFEWKICKQLSLALTKGLRKDIFVPTIGSGAQNTVNKRNDQIIEHQTGDITFNDPIGKPLIDKWSIEAKKGYGKKRKTQTGLIKSSWCILDIFDSQQKCPKLLEFWEQCIRDASESNKLPVLIFERNNRSTCICINLKLFVVLKHTYGNLSCNYCKLTLNNDIFFILNFSDFLSWVNDLSQYLEKYNGEENKT